MPCSSLMRLSCLYCLDCSPDLHERCVMTVPPHCTVPFAGNFKVCVLRKGAICVSAAVVRRVTRVPPCTVLPNLPVTICSVQHQISDIMAQGGMVCLSDVCPSGCRVFGAAFAEMPFVATREGYRREGNLRRLLQVAFRLIVHVILTFLGCDLKWHSMELPAFRVRENLPSCRAGTQQHCPPCPVVLHHSASRRGFCPAGSGVKAEGPGGEAAGGAVREIPAAHVAGQPGLPAPDPGRGGCPGPSARLP